MKKIIAFLVILVMISVIGCASKEPLNVTPTTQSGVVTTTVAGATPSETSQSSKEMPADVKELLAGLEKIKSYAYTVDETKDIVNVRGDKIRIDIFKRVGGFEDGYDTVYMDRISKKAYGVCEGRSCDINHKKDYQNVIYDDYKLITPLDRINEVEYADIVEGTTKMREGATLIPITYEDNDGIKVTMWLHNYYGLPYSIEMDEHQIDYMDIKINSVKEEDVTLKETLVLME